MNGDIKKRIIDVDLTEDFKLISDSSLIKVSVLKKKYLDQMESLNVAALTAKPFETIGRTSEKVLLKYPDGSLATIGIAGFRQWLNDLITYKLRGQSSNNFSLQEIWEETEKVFNSLKQIFTT